MTELTIANVLNVLLFIITVIMLIYGLIKGYDALELTAYNLYLVLAIIVAILNLFGKDYPLF